MQCVNLEQPSYGLVTVNSASQTLTVTAKAPVAGAKGAAIPGSTHVFS